MKIIYPEYQTATGSTATSENGSYPVSNLFDDKPGKLWKAADSVQVATLRIAITTTSDAVALFKTNATSAVCTITLDSAEKAMSASPAVNAGGGLVKLQIAAHGMSAGQVVLINGTTNYDGVHTLPSQALGDAGNLIITATYVAETPAVTDTACVVVETTTHTLSATRIYDRFWQEYTSQVAAHTATIELTTTATTIEAGVVKAGTTVDFRNPSYGLSEGVLDYSTVEELSNGAKYVDTRDIVRSFGINVITTRASEFYALRDIIHAYGKTPMAALIAEDILDMEWCCFGTIESFSGSHQYLNHSGVSITFEETV